MCSRRPEAGDAEVTRARRQAGWSRIRPGVLGLAPQAEGEAERAPGRAGKSRAQTEGMIVGVDTMVAQPRRGSNRRSLVQGEMLGREEDSSDWASGHTSE